MDPTRLVKPRLLDDEAKEVASLDDFLGRLEVLWTRKLLTAEAYATVVTETEARKREIVRSGCHRAALTTAHGLSVSNPESALEWVEIAREIAPENESTSSLRVHLIRRLGQAEHARALVIEGSSEPAQTHFDSAPAGQAPTALVAARAALDVEDYKHVLLICAPLIADELHPLEALALSAFAYRRLNRFDDALACYRRLCIEQPEDKIWPQWVRAIESERENRSYKPSPDVTANRLTHEPVDNRWVEAPARPAWKEIAGEFLLDHWQKLILSLAVLLIVVSSTVGAHVLFGPRLWSPAGSCILALIYTATFAVFGGGLMRWGAVRAGQMMFVTTLVVVPVNFMLAGEMRLILAPTPLRIAIAVLDAFALWAITGRITRAVGFQEGARFLAAALCALGALNALVAAGVPFAWGFAVFSLAPCLYLASVVWLLARVFGPRGDDRASFAYLGLGLLTFAFVAGLLRTAALALPPAAALGAVPAMLTAAACVFAAHALARIDLDRGRIHTLRFAGFVVSALAFALALSRPSHASAFFSGNTLATALLGVALYSISLWKYRNPAYLYFAFAALFAAYFGAFYFVVDLMHSVETVVQRALGYQRPLPFAFRSINGVCFNFALAVLSLHFARRWNDARLARHCHWLGTATSVAACALSTLEPKAAVICLSAYAVLYGLATYVFAQPMLIYAACASLLGSLVFAMTSVPDCRLDQQAAAIETLATVFWLSGWMLARFDVNDVYRKRIRHAMVAAAVLGGMVAVSSLFYSAPSLAIVFAFVVAAGICSIALVEVPHSAFVHLVVAFVTAACLSALRWNAPDSHAPYSLTAVLLAIATLAVARSAQRRGSACSMVVATTLPVSSFVLVLLAVALAIHRRPPGLAMHSTVLALSGGSLLWLSRFRREPFVVYASLGCLVASAMTATLWLVAGAPPGATLGCLALTSAVAATTLAVLGRFGRRRDSFEFYWSPVVNVAIGVGYVGVALAIMGRWDSRSAFPAAALALLLDTFAFLLISRVRVGPDFTYAAIFAFVSATYLTLLSLGPPDPEKAYILGLVGVIEAILFWSVAQLGARLEPSRWLRDYAGPLNRCACLLTALAVLPGGSSPFTMGLAGLSFLLMIGPFPSANWLYAAIGAFAFAFWSAFLRAHADERLMTSAIAGAFALYGCGAILRGWRSAAAGWYPRRELPLEYPCFNLAILAAAIALGLRAELTVHSFVPWYSHAGLLWGVALFCGMQIEVYPKRGWVHAAIAFASLGAFAHAAPQMEEILWWMPLGMILGLFWSLFAAGVGRLDSWSVRWWKHADDDFGGVAQGWSDVLFGLASVWCIVIVAITTYEAAFDDVARAGIEGRGWYAVLLTLLLGALFSNGERCRLDQPADRWVLRHLILIVSAWWLGAPGSPVRLGLSVSPPMFLSSITVLLASISAIYATKDFLFSALGRTHFWPSAVADPFFQTAATRSQSRASSARLSGYHAWVGMVLAIVAALFCGREAGVLAPMILCEGVLSVGLLAVGRDLLPHAYVSATMCGVVCVDVVRVVCVAWRPSLPAGDATLEFAVGAILATFLVWSAAGVLRRSAPVRVCEAWEWIALFGASAAALSLVGVTNPFGGADIFPGVVTQGVLLAVAVFYFLLASRWRVEWPVYSAQAALFVAYLVYRATHAISFANDAVFLTLAGYVEAGLSEILSRRSGSLYARPTFYVSLILPLIPLVAAVFSGRWDDINLFLLFGSATFYAVVCAVRQSRVLGYASAVVFNAMLWLTWSRVGWTVSDHPQFFLVPVGLSTVLFAEVNRCELGRSRVNAVRSVGLLLTYASLATPAWQAQSFGAWLTLLTLSLAGVLVGIGLRAQTFLWIGLVGFVFDIVFELGRMGREHALAKWGIMLALGIVLVLFVALNEKRQLVISIRKFYDEARQWD